jgi:hypothetical protein
MLILTRSTCLMLAGILLLLPGCASQPSAGPAGGAASGAPASASAPRLYLPLVSMSSSACPTEYDEIHADGSTWHVRANCDGSFDSVQKPAPGPLPTLPPPVAGCPTGCSVAPPGCVIKGSISISGEKIYHLPGWKLYAETEIDPRFGDRWFCTTAEAVANGWQPSTIR